MKQSLLAVLCLLITLGWPTISEAKHFKHWQDEPASNRRCPFSCRTEGISKDHCRDWRHGNICYVQDTWGGRARLAPPAVSFYPAPIPYRGTYYSPAYGYREPTVGEELGRKVDNAIDHAVGR